MGPSSTALVEGILAADKESAERPLEQYRRDCTFYAARQFGSKGTDDVVAQSVSQGLETILFGSMRASERLWGFVRIMTRRISSLSIGERMQARKPKNGIDHELPACHGLPKTTELLEDSLFQAQSHAVMLRVLSAMSGRDCEVFCRLYLLEQSLEQIQIELTEMRFKVTKIRAKGRLGERGKQLMNSPFPRRLPQPEIPLVPYIAYA